MDKRTDTFLERLYGEGMGRRQTHGQTRGQTHGHPDSMKESAKSLPLYLQGYLVTELFSRIQSLFSIFKSILFQNKMTIYEI